LVIKVFNFEEFVWSNFSDHLFYLLFCKNNIRYNGYAILIIITLIKTSTLWHNPNVPIELNINVNSCVSACLKFNVYLYYVCFESKLLIWYIKWVRIFVALPIKINQQRSHNVAADFVLAFNHSHQIRKKNELQKLCTFTLKKFISHRYFMYEVHCNVLVRTHHRKLSIQLDPAKTT